MGTCQNRLGDAVLTTTTFYVLEQKLKKNEYPCKPVFNYIKVGGRGCSLHRHVIIMRDDNMPVQVQYAAILTTVKTTIFR